MDTLIRVTDQLGPHLKSLRKARGLSQSALGKLIGVGQTRITEIEANPGLVNLEQLMKVFRALNIELILRGKDITMRPTSVDVSDDTTINLNNQHELRYWTKAFGVTVDELRQAIQAVGHASRVADVDGAQRSMEQEPTLQSAPSDMPAQWHISTKALRRAIEQKLEKSEGTALHRDAHKGTW